MGFDAFHHFLFKFPAGHLPGIQLPCQLISRNFRVMAHLVSQPESLGKGQVATMENRMGCS
jgi:hypothetical protein